MFKIDAMSKISTLQYKNKTIDVSIREKLGKHGAPYIVIHLQDGTEAHITIKEKEVFDSTIKKADIINFVKSWIDAYYNELEVSWKAALKGKALKVPSTMPKPIEEKKLKKKKTKSTISTFKVRKIKELRTNKNLQMIIRFDNNEIRLVDFKKDVIPYNTAFKVLTNPKKFMTAKPYGSAVLWEEDDIDIEASDLYNVSYAVELPNIKFA
jgi:hypothetical protein